jgi:hypothetical protein
MGGFYFRNSAIYKAVRIAGEEDTPSPWGPAIGALLGGWLIAGLLAAFGRSLGG